MLQTHAIKIEHVSTMIQTKIQSLPISQVATQDLLWELIDTFS